MKIERGLALEMARITEAAALKSGRWVGRGNKISADAAATNAMRGTLNRRDIDGTVVIGEGEMDKAPMLYIGERLGKSGLKVDIAVDPLEGTNICANGELVQGVRYFAGGARTHTVVMRSSSRTVRFIETLHYFDYKPGYTD